MLRPLLSMLLALVATFTVAQTTLRGKVSDEKNLLLGSVTVKAYIAGKSNILAYTRTDDQGTFSLPVSTPACGSASTCVVTREPVAVPISLLA